MRKITSAIISTAVMMSFWAAGSEKNTVYAEDYSIGIEMESQEIPVNFIEKDRAVYVPVKITGNPGITSLYFVFEYDEKFEDYMVAVTYGNNSFENEVMSYSNGNDNYVGIIGGYSENYYLDQDGIYCSLKLKLPENYAVGDCYTLRFLREDYDVGRCAKFTKDGETYGQDCFWYTDAEVRIVDAEMVGIIPEETEPPKTPQPPEMPSDVQTEEHTEPPMKQNTTENRDDSDSGDLSENKSNEQSYSQTVTEISQKKENISTSVSSSSAITSEVSAVLSSLTVKASDISSETSGSVSVTVQTSETGIFTDTFESESPTQDSDGRKGSSEIPILAAATAGVVVAGVFAALKNKKQKGKK